MSGGNKPSFSSLLRNVTGNAYRPVPGMSGLSKVGGGLRNVGDALSITSQTNMIHQALANLASSPSEARKGFGEVRLDPSDSSRLFRKLTNTFANVERTLPKEKKSVRKRHHRRAPSVAAVKVAVCVDPRASSSTSHDEHIVSAATDTELTVRPPSNGLLTASTRHTARRGGGTPWRTPARPNPKTFTFDQIFVNPDSDRTKNGDGLYTAVRPFIGFVFEGKNSTVFSYGSASSGKTFAVMGDAGHVGILPRMVSDLFLMAKERSTTNRKFRVSLGYVELYCNKFRDLLATESSLTNELRLEEPGRRREVTLKGSDSLRTFVRTPEEAIMLIRQGNANIRGRAGIKAHTIVTFYVSTTLDDGTVSRTSKLHLIDLAANDNSLSIVGPHASGQDLKEAESVNLSLTCLSNVLMSLTASSDLWLIPYRNSKLTHFLKDSLGGDAHALFLAHINHGADSYRETMTTLEYASRVRAIAPLQPQGDREFTAADAADASLLREKLRQINVYQQQVLERNGQVKELEVKNSEACEESERLREDMNVLLKKHEEDTRLLNAKIMELQTLADPRLLQELSQLREKRVASERKHAEEQTRLQSKIEYIEQRALHEAEVIDDLRADLESAKTQLNQRMRELCHSRAVAVQAAEVRRVNAEIDSLLHAESSRQSRLSRMRLRDDLDHADGKLESTLLQRNVLAQHAKQLVQTLEETRQYALRLESHVEKASRKIQKQKQQKAKYLEGLADSEQITIDYERKWLKAEKELSKLKGMVKEAKQRRTTRLRHGHQDTEMASATIMPIGEAEEEDTDGVKPTVEQDVESEPAVEHDAERGAAVEQDAESEPVVEQDVGAEPALEQNVLDDSTESVDEKIAPALPTAQETLAETSAEKDEEEEEIAQEEVAVSVDASIDALLDDDEEDTPVGDAKKRKRDTMEVVEEIDHLLEDTDDDASSMLTGDDSMLLDTSLNTRQQQPWQDGDEKVKTKKPRRRRGGSSSLSVRRRR